MNLKRIRYKQGYGKIIERLKYLMLTVHRSAERLLPSHPGKNLVVPLTSKNKRIETIAYCLKTMIYRFSQQLFPRRKPVCVADSGREILNQADTTGAGFNRA